LCQSSTRRRRSAASTGLRNRRRNDLPDDERRGSEIAVKILGHVENDLPSASFTSKISMNVESNISTHSQNAHTLNSSNEFF